MRRLKKEWRDRRHPWNRRVRWYADEADTDIRLKLTDTEGEANRFYRNKEATQRDWDRFKHGTVGVLALMREKQEERC